MNRCGIALWFFPRSASRVSRRRLGRSWRTRKGAGTLLQANQRTSSDAQ